MKYAWLGLLTFFLWCLATLTQNSAKNLIALGYLAEANQLFLPMWLFTIACAISLITLLLVALRDINKLH
jgi:hypothetical protein